MQLQMQAWWYLQSAEGGSSRGMYNTALCLRSGEGVNRNLFEAKRWMRRAAMAGHGKAMFEHGLTLFAVCTVLGVSNLETNLTFIRSHASHYMFPFSCN